MCFKIISNSDQEKNWAVTISIEFFNFWFETNKCNRTKNFNYNQFCSTKKERRNLQDRFVQEESFQKKSSNVTPLIFRIQEWDVGWCQESLITEKLDESSKSLHCDVTLGMILWKEEIIKRKMNSWITNQSWSSLCLSFQSRPDQIKWRSIDGDQSRDRRDTSWCTREGQRCPS